MKYLSILIALVLLALAFFACRDNVAAVRDWHYSITDNIGADLPTHQQ